MLCFVDGDDIEPIGGVTGVWVNCVCGPILGDTNLEMVKNISTYILELRECY